MMGGADRQDSVTGLLLAGIGDVTDQQQKNFMIVDASGYSLARMALSSHPRRRIGVGQEGEGGGWRWLVPEAVQEEG